MFKKRIKYLILGIFCFILGAALLQPAFSTLSDIYVTKSWEKRYLSGYYLNKHDADVRYYRKGVGDSRYVNTTSDTMSGTLTAGDYAYSSSKTRYLTIAGTAFNTLGDLEIERSGYKLGCISNRWHTCLCCCTSKSTQWSYCDFFYNVLL